MRPFHLAEPNVEVQIRSATSAPDWGDLDAAVLFGDGRWPGCRATPLVSNRVMPVCSPSFLKDHGPMTTPWDVAGKTLLYSLTRPEDWSAWLQSVGVDAPLALQSRRLGYESSLLAYQACRHGLGMAMAQVTLVSTDLAEGSLVAPFDDQLDLERTTYYMVMPHRKKQDPSVSRLVKWLTTVPGR